ncbi:hypothetical protein [Klenkia brasiliensis]|uniref:Uncharacterized protein n=1 Tax=Klenkia brasiliensis TaxID=333142 RepID=A0A1G8A5K2_9ACTN|nr:hypothetical protein [Klenkia brasiliensis]SDH16208.1 hypothetical protein SAMN05660324_0059 [Klenkia brasiliensis]
MTISRTDRVRLVSAGLGAGGLALLLLPRWSLRTLAPGRRAPAAWLVRVLGARTVLQSALLLASPTREGMQAGAAVDALHAASMVPAALVWPRFRQAAAISGGWAAAATAAQLAVAPLADDPVHVPGDVD